MSNGITDIEAGYKAHIARIRNLSSYDSITLSILLSRLCVTVPGLEDQIHHNLPTCELLKDILPNIIEEEYANSEKENR